MNGGKTKPFCGAGEVPKGYHRGSMLECLDKNQVRYWGVKKVDPKIFETSKLLKSKDSDLTKKELRALYVKYTANINGLRRKYKEEESDAEKKKIKQKAEKLNKEIQKILKLIKIAEKKEKHDKENKDEKSKGVKNTKKTKDTKDMKVKKIKKSKK